MSIRTILYLETTYYVSKLCIYQTNSEEEKWGLANTKEDENKNKMLPENWAY